MYKFALAIFILCPLSGHAAPPAGTDMSLAPWYQDLKVPNNGTPTAGLGCCSLADCRPVKYRSVGDHYEAYLDSKTFAGGPDAWTPVPNEVVLHQKDNPTGEGVACLYLGQVRCFVPASGT